MSIATTCPSCAQPARDSDGFCESCGTGAPRDAESARVAHRTPTGGPAPSPAFTCLTCGHPMIDNDGFCQRCGRGQPAARDRMAVDLGAVAGVSDRGTLRERNADAMAFGRTGQEHQPHAVVAVVCDGVGGGAQADRAAQLAADAATDILLGDGDAAELTAGAAAAAGAAIAELGDGAGLSTTLVSLIMTAKEITIGWLGDSRAYWVSPSPAPGLGMLGRFVTSSDRITNDHATIDRPTSGNGNRPRALTRWLGAKAENMTPQVITVRPVGPGAVVLCTDGLWGYLPEAEAIAGRVRGSGGAMGAATALVTTALECGGGDNITVVAAPFPPGGRLP